MSKIHLTLEVNKINKAKIIDRTFTNQAGEEVTVKEYKCEVVPLKEKKFVTKGDNWEMFKTHFVVEKKDNKDEPDIFVGNGYTFENTNEEPKKDTKTSETLEGNVIDTDDIPF
jgi:hypothetical protein